MKTILASTIFLLIGLGTFAQKDAMQTALAAGPDLTVKTQSVKLNKDQQPAFTIDVIGSKKDVEDAWEDFMEDRYQIKFEKKKGVCSATGVSIPLIAPGFLALHTTYMEEDTRTRINAWVDLGGQFLDGQSPNSSGMKTLMSEFMGSYYAEVYADVLNDQNKALSSLTKDKERLQKDAEKLQKDVSKRTEDIEDAKTDTMEAKQKITELNSKIDELASDVQKYESEIASLKKEQEKKTEEIAKQTTKVEAQRARLEALRSQSDKVNKQK